MFFATQKISCPLARISSFFQNYFLLIPIMVSTSSKIALTKKILFLLGTKSVSTSWMKDIEKYVATIWKSCLYFTKFLKKLVSNGFSLKIDFPLISIIVCQQKKSDNKATLFSVDKKLDFTSRNEGLTEKYASVEE